MSVDDIVGEHPDLQPEDIPAALNYAAEAACVRFLIDENLSPRICPLLIAGGHHATHIRDHDTNRRSSFYGSFPMSSEPLTSRPCS